jgi:hypothetical protein
MKKQNISFLIALIIILLSTPLGYAITKIVYSHQNLTGEYAPILNNFMHSFIIIGVLIFIIGIVDLNKNK